MRLSPKADPPRRCTSDNVSLVLEYQLFDNFKLPHGGTHTGNESSPGKLISSGTAHTSKSSYRSCRESDVCQNEKREVEQRECKRLRKLGAKSAPVI